VLARECAHVGRVIGIGAGAAGCSGQRLATCVGVGRVRTCGVSGREAFVAVVQAADFGQLHDLAHAGRVGMAFGSGVSLPSDRCVRDL
jgi:hypothetical protein